MITTLSTAETKTAERAIRSARRYRDLGNALHAWRRSATFVTTGLVMGDDGFFWLTTDRAAKLLARAGYERLDWHGALIPAPRA